MSNPAVKFLGKTEKKPNCLVEGKSKKNESQEIVVLWRNSLTQKNG